MPQTLGVIAGSGQLPRLIVEGMRAQGHIVCGIGLRNQYEADFPALCDQFTDVGLYRIGGWIRACKRFGVDEAVMVGGVKKQRMHDPLRAVRDFPDLRSIWLWYRRLRHDRRSAALLGAIADELGAHGVRLIDSTTHIPDHLALPGRMTRCAVPNPSDVCFGWQLLVDAVELGIGQAMSVRGRDVIAVEALEGTDQMIERTGSLCPRKGWTLLKTASRNHDMRADVPTVGVKTIHEMKEHGGSCLVVGTSRVIFIDRAVVIRAADEAGIAILGVGEEGPEAALDMTAEANGG